MKPGCIFRIGSILGQVIIVGNLDVHVGMDAHILRADDN